MGLIDEKVREKLKALTRDDKKYLRNIFAKYPVFEAVLNKKYNNFGFGTILKDSVYGRNIPTRNIMSR